MLLAEIGPAEDDHDLAIAPHDLKRQTVAGQSSCDRDLLVDITFGFATGVGHFENARDPIDSREGIGFSERVTATSAGNHEVHDILFLVIAVGRRFSERHVPFETIGHVAALDVERHLPCIVGVRVDCVAGPAARNRVSQPNVRDGEPFEANRVDFGREFDCLGACRFFLQVFDQCLAERRGRSRRVFGHHHQVAAEGLVLRPGRASTQIVGQDGRDVGIAVVLALDGEPARVAETRERLRRIVRVLDDAIAADGARLIGPAEAHEGA